MAARNGRSSPPTPDSVSKGRHVHGNDNSMRHRSHTNTSRTSRHQYNNAIGDSRDDDDMFGSSQQSQTLASDHHHRRRKEIRGRIHEKKKAKVPLKYQIAWTKFMHSTTKNHIVACIGEFIGTTMFLYFAFAGTQVANIGAGQTTSGTTTGAATGFNPTVYLYIAFCFGFSLMVNAWIFFRISGGLFNPAVTLALFLLGALDIIRAIILVFSQISGACFAAYLVSVMFPTPFNVQTTLATGTSLAQGLWIEAMCTAELVFTIIMLAKEKHRATFIAPVGIGLALFISELVAVYYTGGSLNPARSFGPAAVAHQFATDHWIYWVGPCIGALLAVLFYRMFKILEYEMVNPGQDGDIENDPTQNPDHEIAQMVEERAEEVQEIQAIQEQPGGLDALLDGQLSVEGSVLHEDGVVGMAYQGVKEGDDVVVVRKRSNEPDLEAQWNPEAGNFAGVAESTQSDVEKLHPTGSRDERGTLRQVSRGERGEKLHPMGSRDERGASRQVSREENVVKQDH